MSNHLNPLREAITFNVSVDSKRPRACASSASTVSLLFEPGTEMMPQEEAERCWMRNKDFYLGILEAISARMEALGITLAELSFATGLEPRRLTHILNGMIEDVTLLDLDNMLLAVKLTPQRFEAA